MSSHSVSDFIEHLSEKPWSMYTKADYSIEQWHAACLIHQHDGPPTSKDQCKLPCKTPNGAVNRNGVYAAAAALAGARGGVQASARQKDAAARTVARYYKEMGKEPPPSITKHSNTSEFIEHYGVKGMHWGIRNRIQRRRTKKETRTRAAREQLLLRRRQISDTDLKTFVERLNNEKKLKALINEDLKPGRTAVKKFLGSTGGRVAATVATGAATVAVKYAVERKLTPKKERKKIKLDPLETAGIIARGKMKK
jgi:hypothetical protein